MRIVAGGRGVVIYISVMDIHACRREQVVLSIDRYKQVCSKVEVVWGSLRRGGILSQLAGAGSTLRYHCG